MFKYKIRTDNRKFNYTPTMSLDDFIRNNELTELEMEDTERIKKVMINLYETRLEENF